MDKKQKKAMERLEKMYQNPKYKDAIDAFAQMEDAKMALRGVLAEAKMVDVVTNRWRR